MKIKYPLATDTWDNKEVQAIKKVLSSRKLTYGKFVFKFEKDFSKFLNLKYSVMVNSGSSANLLMVASLFYTKNKKIKINKNDEVIVPAIGWSTSYAPFFQYGLKIKFVDVDIKNLNYDLSSLKKAISKKTRLILAINICGNPNKFDEIKKIINLNKRIILLEDNCEALGAKFKNNYAGTFGLMSTSSFFFSHHISTIEGGMVSTNDKELYNILKSLRSHGWTRDFYQKKKKINKSNIYNYFNFVLPGYNLRPTEINAVAGIQQLQKLRSFVNNRRINYNYLKKVIKSKNYYTQEEIGNSSPFWLTLIKKKEAKVDLKKTIYKLKQAGFEIRPIVTGNFAKQPVCRYFNFSKFGKLKNADYISKNSFAIGNSHLNLKKTINKLIKYL
jgi:CDP-6-deoxy-D-xylo-4-hexulose-3-dehydrase